MSVNVSRPLPLLAVEANEREERLRHAVDANYLFVWRSLRRYGIPDDEADDVAQEVFLLFSQKLESVEHGLEKRFLFRSAVHLAMHARRSFRRRRTLEEKAATLEIVKTHASAEEDAQRRESLVLLDSLLGELSEELREVVVLCELEGMTMNEVATLLGLRPGTVASRLRRSREALSACVARRREEAP